MYIKHGIVSRREGGGGVDVSNKYFFIELTDKNILDSLLCRFFLFSDYLHILFYFFNMLFYIVYLTNVLYSILICHFDVVKKMLILMIM